MGNHKWQRIFFWLSPKRVIRSIDSSVWFLVPKTNRKIAFQKLEEALSLIREYSPVRFTQLSGDVEKILVAGDPSFHGQYIRELNLIELYDDYVISSETTVEELASTLVHEAQHARQFRLGIGYDETERDRVERMCFLSERNFGRRIPSGSKVIEKAEAWLNISSGHHFSNEARKEAKFEALEKLGCPAWLINLLKWWVQRKAT